VQYVQPFGVMTSEFEGLAVNKNTLILLGFAVFIGLGLAYFSKKGDMPEGIPVEVALPELSAEAKIGKKRFEANCMRCHGLNAAGTNKGPPLIHKIYEPGHHSDLSFQRAAKFGVRAHHWPFGNMPPVSGVGEGDVSQIILYVREVQRANGIY